ncbi:MAG: WecB/TagA/CpsF family glycosyltransferase, partial [Chloroflexota bacterium]
MRILGVRVDDVTLAEAAAAAERFMVEGTPHQLATVNPEFVMEARRNPDFAQVLREADLCVPDGVGLIWASRLLRQPLRARAPGVELVWALAGLCAERDRTLFLLGGRDGVARDAARRLQARFPRLRLAGTFEGNPRGPEAPARVRAAAPDVLLVAYGHPRQDLWIHQQQAELRVPVAVGVGGAFDFIAGRTHRAPAWLRRLGLEWLHRLAREPWRWRRMLALP